VESRLKVNPSEAAAVILLGREDVGSKVVLVEEPVRPEGVQDCENRGAVGGIWPDYHWV
jgi:hypothetical protein